jgi:hypothetical protein
MDQSGQRAKDNTQAWDGAAYAIAHGGTATNGAVDGFVRYLVASNATIKSTDDLAAAWNRYVGTVSMAGNSTADLTLGLTAQQQSQQAVNRYLGEGLIAGNRFNDTLSGQTTAAIALANAMPKVGFGLGQAATAFAGSMTAADDYNRALRDMEVTGTITARALESTATAALLLYDKVTTLPPTLGLTALGLKDVDTYGTAAQTAMNDTPARRWRPPSPSTPPTPASPISARPGSHAEGLQEHPPGRVRRAGREARRDAAQRRRREEARRRREARSGLSATSASARRAEIRQGAALGRRPRSSAAALADLNAKAGPGTLSAADVQRQKDLRRRSPRWRRRSSRARRSPRRRTRASPPSPPRSTT